jgi:very-short-patch-repair endonuclease
LHAAALTKFPTDPVLPRFRGPKFSHRDNVRDHPESLVTTRASLRAGGHSDQDIARSVETGRLIRLRRGWYAVPHVPADLREAVARGGRIACVSALDWHGVWTMPHGLHISVPRNGHRDTVGLTHWTTARRLTPDTLVDDPLTAFTQFTVCGSELEVVVAADSAMNLAILTESDVTAVLGRTRRSRRLLARIDGSAQSGTETIVRLALRFARIPARAQVPIPGVGRVDFVVGDRLAVEVDSRAWHDNDAAFEADRRRDAALVALGYLVLRLSYRRVMYERDHLLDEVRKVVARGDHRWAPRHRGNSG